MRRIDCLAAIYDDLRDCAVVTIMGAVAAELYSLGHRANFFYLEHAMGLASSMGLGIALAQPRRKVVVIDGDGSVLMNLGGLTTLARYAPPNLTQIVFDNESLLSVGGFPTATSTGSDLAAIARGAGIGNARSVADLEDFVAAARAAIAAPALACLVAKVEAVGPASFHMDLHLLENRFEFARALRLPASAELPEAPPRPEPRAAEPITAAPTVARAAFPDPTKEESR
jgi:sulfopyruvate decarboxylase subunit beta